MKKLKQVLSLFLIVFFVTSLQAQEQVNSENITKVKFFLEKFNKNVFFKDIIHHNNLVEATVRELKRKEKTTEELKILYSNTQQSYNYVLATMDIEIQKTSNFIDFHLFDTQKRYAAEIEFAKLQETAFLNAAKVALNIEAGFFSDLIINLLSNIFPLVKKLNDNYLKMAKWKMHQKIESLKFKDYDDI